MLHEKNSRVSLCVQELFCPQVSLWILATIPVCRNNTGLTVLVHPHIRMTRLLEGGSEWSISFEGVMDLEVAKLEEELGTKFSVLHCIRVPFLMRCGFWPLIHSYEYPCSSQSFPSEKNCWRVLEDFHCQEYIQFFDIHCGIFMRLHFTIGCYDRRRTCWCRHGFQFSRIQILFADHVHRRSGVYNKFSFLRFKFWWRRQAPIFRRWEECCFTFTL